MLLRLVMKSFRSGCVNKYADVDADTPERTPSRSAALQLGGLAPGSWLAWASGVAPKSAAPIPALVRTAVTSRHTIMADSLRPAAQRRANRKLFHSRFGQCSQQRDVDGRVPIRKVCCKR